MKRFFGDDEVTYEDGRQCLGCARWFPVTARYWYMRDDYKKDRGVTALRQVQRMSVRRRSRAGTRAA